MQEQASEMGTQHMEWIGTLHMEWIGTLQMEWIGTLQMECVRCKNGLTSSPSVEVGKYPKNERGGYSDGVPTLL